MIEALTALACLNLIALPINVWFASRNIEHAKENKRWADKLFKKQVHLEELSTIKYLYSDNE